MSNYHYIACDLGAESGRVILGHLNEGILTLEEIHRFPNNGIRVLGSLRWDVLRIFDELKTGLRRIGARRHSISSLSVDSWGVDYVLLKGGEPLLTLPYHYRDTRSDAPYENALNTAPETIFAETGIQFMPLNMLYQLIAEVEQRPEILDFADQFLNIADYFHYLFCGEGKVEESMASTTQIYNPITKNWSSVLQEKFGFRKEIFPPVVPSGTKLGNLLPEIEAETALQSVQVIATCSHDTGAAVAAVPAEGDDWAYLSSGTWSLLGVELPRPLINEHVRAANFTNEIGYGSTTRFLKNIVGLWILQECRRTWAKEGQEFDYSQLTQLAADAEPFRSLIHPAAARFGKPDNMPQKIAEYCRETGQPEPETTGQYVRCILESLALLYRTTLEELSQLTGKSVRRLHIVGGGSNNHLLNQFAANATETTVFAGPVEATAIGNLLIQAVTLGHLDSLEALRKAVRNSFPVQAFEPAETNVWRSAYEKFSRLEILT